jgi:hypothetical protein
MGDIHSPEAIEQIRRSAAMADLAHDTVMDVLAGCAELARRHREVERILGQLQPSWRNAKDCLNRLAAIVHDRSPK